MHHCAVKSMAMCGDDDVVRNGRLVSHHRLAAFVAQRRKNEHRELGVLQWD